MSLIYTKYLFNEIFPTQKKYTITMTEKIAVLNTKNNTHTINISSTKLFKDLLNQIKEIHNIPQHAYYGDDLFITNESNNWKKNNIINKSKAYQEVFTEITDKISVVTEILFRGKIDDAISLKMKYRVY